MSRLFLEPTPHRTLVPVLFVAALLMASAAQAQWCQDPYGGAYWCGDPDACVGICGQSGNDCTTPCKRLGGSWTTCGAFSGNPENDLDNDGVANDFDNCVCASNTNQTDCDTDGIGDVCDPQNVKWVFRRALGQCDYDADNSFGQITIEVYEADEYRNVCDNSLCFKKQEIRHDRCLWTSSCGWSDAACCQCLSSQHGINYCGVDNNCGSQECPF